MDLPDRDDYYVDQHSTEFLVSLEEILFMGNLTIRKRLTVHPKEKAMSEAPVQIFTQAPIPPADLRRKFTENVEFVLDYDAGKFKGKVLMVYLSNLDIKVQLKINDHAEAMLLLAEYLKITTLVNIPVIENLAVHMLLAHTGKQHLLDFDPSAFLAEHAELLDMWVTRINSLYLYAFHSMGQLSVVESYPQDPNDGVSGINFVHLIKHELFPVLLTDVPDSKWNWNKKFFNEYIFAGSNLFKFFADQNNPLFMGILAMQDAESFASVVPALMAGTAELDKLQASLKLRIEHVPSV